MLNNSVINGTHVCHCSLRALMSIEYNLLNWTSQIILQILTLFISHQNRGKNGTLVSTQLFTRFSVQEQCFLTLVLEVLYVLVFSLLFTPLLSLCSYFISHYLLIFSLLLHLFTDIALYYPQWSLASQLQQYYSLFALDVVVRCLFRVFHVYLRSFRPLSTEVYLFSLFILIVLPVLSTAVYRFEPTNIIFTD